MFADVFDCHNWGRSCYWHLVGREARDSITHSKIHWCFAQQRIIQSKISIILRYTRLQHPVRIQFNDISAAHRNYREVREIRVHTLPCSPSSIGWCRLQSVLGSFPLIHLLSSLWGSRRDSLLLLCSEMWVQFNMILGSMIQVNRFQSKVVRGESSSFAIYPICDVFEFEFSICKMWKVIPLL